MKNYKYRLETLLKMCEQKEREKQLELSKITRKITNENEKLAEISQSQNKNFGTLTERTKKSFTVLDMLVYGRYFAKLKKDTLVSKELLKALKSEESNKRDELIKATIEKKKHEKLKEKQKKDFIESVEVAETKETDEIAITGFNRKLRFSK